MVNILRKWIIVWLIFIEIRRLLLTLLLVASSQQSSAATCRFFQDTFFGYSCELLDASVTEPNTVLEINTENHSENRTDADVTHFTLGASSSLSFFPNSILQQFPSLRYLLLERSGLTALSAGDFAGCADLTILRIRYTSLTTIPAGLFGDCASLRILDLAANEINDIHEDAFVDLTDLIELELYSNAITTIQSGLLRSLVNVEDLFFANNSISTIGVGAFSELSGLYIFDLSENLITEINETMFGDEIWLINFNLNNNRLSAVPRLPSVAPRIKYIYLNDNQITNIRDDDFTFAYSNVTNIHLASNLITEVSAAPFEVLTSLDVLELSFNSITSLDHELFDRIPSLYTFYFISNNCASVRYTNIRSIDQDAIIERSLERCYYNFFEPVISHPCTYVMDVDTGYTCVLSDITFQNFRDKFIFTGEHLADLNNTVVTGLRITASNFSRVPPTIFRTFPSLQFLSLTHSQLEHIDENTFEECGIIHWLDLTGNRIRRLPQNSFANCYYVEELILDDNRINEIAPCNIFLTNIYQTQRLSLRNNICVDRVIEAYSGGWLIYEYTDDVNRFLNQCYSLWYTFLDTSERVPAPVIGYF